VSATAGCKSGPDALQTGFLKANGFNPPAFLTMKKRLLPLVLILTLFFPMAALVRAADEKPAPKEEETELGKTMEKLNGAWRKLRKQAADPASNASSLELVAVIATASEKALTLQPDKVKDVPAADREKFVQDYQAKMKEFMAKLAKLNDAFKAGDNPAAVALIKELGALQRESHKEYKRPDK
jgi:soluble cytochrome b562